MNQTIFYFLNNLASQYEWLDILIIFCAQWLPYLIVGVLVFYYIYKIRHCERSEAIQEAKNLSIILISTIAIWGVSQIINYFYYSPRPFLILDNINLLFEHGNADSFPSGHTTFFFTLALMSYYYSPRLLTAFFLDGAVLIALCRIIAGVHWPTDILGGIILAGVGVFVIKLVLSLRGRSPKQSREVRPL